MSFNPARPDSGISEAHARDRVRVLLKEIEVAMLTTVADDGSLRSRPMAVHMTEGGSEIWLFTIEDTPKVDEIEHEHHVGLSFIDSANSRYVSVSGKARIVRDREKARRYWRPELERWIPGGLQHPRLAMLRVNVTSVEFWDASEQRMRNMVETIAAPFSGVPPEPAGEYAKVQLP